MITDDKDYTVLNLNDSQPVCQRLNDLLNNGYYILKEYIFDDKCILILKKTSNNGNVTLSGRISGDDIKFKTD